MRARNSPPVAAPRRIAALNRWAALVLRLLVIALTANVVSALPLPLLDNWLPARNVIVAILAVVASGKALFDTLFYERFQP